MFDGFIPYGVGGHGGGMKMPGHCAVVKGSDDCSHAKGDRVHAEGAEARGISLNAKLLSPWVDD